MISVLVVDDSIFMRKVISSILSSDPEIKVCGVARDGYEAIEMAGELKPDVITLDVIMPRLDGIAALKEIMRKFPTPVVMLSALTSEGSRLTIEALEIGAVDFVQKPSGAQSPDLEKVKEELISKVKVAATAKVGLKKEDVSSKDHKFVTHKKKAVVIVSSTGGPATLEQIIPFISKDLPAFVFVVQHMPSGFTQALASRLNLLSQIPVREAIDGEEIQEGIVYFAPGGFHMLVKKYKEGAEEKNRISLTIDAPVFGLRPYGNFTIESVAEIFQERTICVVLTGMGNDGTDGAKKVKEKNGTVLAEQESDCVISGMPRAVMTAGVVDEIVPLKLIADKIMRAVAK